MFFSFPAVNWDERCKKVENLPKLWLILQHLYDIEIAHLALNEVNAHCNRTESAPTWNDHHHHHHEHQ